MQNITSTADLKNEIQFLEVEQELKGQLLKEQFHQTLEGLKPVNILKRMMDDVASSPILIENILKSALGLASGYLSRKLIAGGSANIFRNIIGSLLQFGITNIAVQRPDVFKSAGQFILQHIFRKK